MVYIEGADDIYSEGDDIDVVADKLDPLGGLGRLGDERVGVSRNV